MKVVRHRVVVDLTEAAFLRADAAREIAEVVDGERDVRSEGLANRLAVVDRFRECERLEVCFHPIGDSVEDVGSIRG